MTKNLLIKVIRSEANPEERNSVLEWINKDERNLKYFIELKELWTVIHLPEEKAGGDYMTKLHAIIDGHKGERKNKFLTFKRIYLSSAAVIILLLALNITLILKNNRKEISPEPASTVVLCDDPVLYKHTLYTNKGVKAFTELSDGTQVWLNSDSKITFPDTFLGPTREITISGEAFFDVAKDSLKPMIITTNRNFQIKVLGTKLNVKTNDNDLEARVTLHSGMVEIITSQRVAGKVLQSSVILKDQQSYIVSDHKPPALVDRADTLKQTAWKNGKLIFESTPLNEVIKQLERWHGVEFTVEDKAAYDIRFTAEFEQESIVQIMEMLKFCSMIDYRIPNRKSVVICMK